MGKVPVCTRRPVRLDDAVGVHRAADFAGDVVMECLEIAGRLKTDKVVSQKMAHEALVVEERGQDLGRRERDVEEEPERRGRAGRA